MYCLPLDRLYCPPLNRAYRLLLLSVYCLLLGGACAACRPARCQEGLLERTR